MATLDFSRIGQPLPGDAPCGPDLDMEGDPEHLNFCARVEGVLPASFAQFDRASIDFKSELAAAAGILAVTRDLRILVLVAKLLILDRQDKAFAACLTAMAELLETCWEEVHPQPMGGDVSFREGILLALDDLPHVVLPLQAVPLFETRRLGRVTYRQHLIASGAVPPREGEDSQQPGAIQAALTEVEDEALTGTLDGLAAMQVALRRMSATFEQHLGKGRGLSLPKLTELLAGMLDFLRAEAQRRNPAAAVAEVAEGAGEPSEATRPEPVGTIANRRAAMTALAALDSYFSRHEPSSLALPLVRQATQLARLSFTEAMRLLVPDLMGSASLRFGRDVGFNVPMDHLGQFELPMEEEAASDSGGEDAMPAPTTRAQANDLLGAVATFFRQAEPSSPVPLLLERAKGMSGRDFLSILQELVPASGLRPPEES